ncbi:MAG: DUF4157 domain-containing protein [Enhygromyxa sp.]
MSFVTISKRAKPEGTKSRQVNRPFARSSTPTSSADGQPRAFDGIHAKLMVGAVNDPLEAEADARPGGHPSQDTTNVRLPGATRPLPVSPPTDRAEREAERGRDALNHDGATPHPVVHEPTAPKVLASRWSSDEGAPMPAALRVSADRAFGADFSNVRIHDDVRAQSWAEQLRARAFTVGADIYFGAGQFRPQTQDGRRVIAHELTHVVQQAQSPGAPMIHRMPAPGGPSSDDVAAERREIGLERKRHQLLVALEGGDFGRVLDLLHGFDGDEFSLIVNGLTNAEANALFDIAKSRGDGELEQKLREVRGLTQSDLPAMSPLAAEVFEVEHGKTLQNIRSLIREGKFRKALQQLRWLDSTAFDVVVDALTTEEVSLLLRRGGRLSARATRERIRAARSQEVVVNTILLSNANDTIDADFARANQIFNPIGIEIERGAHARLRPSQLSGTGPLDAKNPEHTERFFDNFPDRRRITAFWVNGNVQRYFGYHKVVENSAHGVVIDNTKRQDTFAHEVGHALGLPHLTELATDPGADPNNLMAAGGYRTTTGVAGSDILDAEQQETILRSELLESGRRGVGR